LGEGAHRASDGGGEEPAPTPPYSTVIFFDCVGTLVDTISVQHG
jgi:hypothetical protein